MLPFHANQSVLITSCSSRSVFCIAKRSAFLFTLLPYCFSHDYAANRSLRSIAQLFLFQNFAPCFLKDSLKLLLPFHIHSFTVVRSTFSRIICLNSSLPHCCFLLSQDIRFVTSQSVSYPSHKSSLRTSSSLFPVSDTYDLFLGRTRFIALDGPPQKKSKIDHHTHPSKFVIFSPSCILK